MNQWCRAKKILFCIVVFILLEIIMCYVMGVTVDAIKVLIGPSTQSYPRYYLFETSESQKYLEFLEKIDEEGYEIIDTSIGVDGSEEFYMITYKIT